MWCSTTAILPNKLPPELRAAHEKRAARVAEIGEAFLTYFEPHDLNAKLLNLGFAEIEDLGPRQIAARYFLNGATTPPDKGGHIVRATTIASRTERDAVRSPLEFGGSGVQ